jgi:Acetyltransferase (GNAT) family
MPDARVKGGSGLALPSPPSRCGRLPRPMPSSATSCTRPPWASTSRRSGGGMSRSSAPFMRAFNPHRWQIVTDGETDIGMLDVDYRSTEIYLSRIEIHPGHQSHGIGTRIISALAEQAERKGQDLVLDVLTVNRRAQALYRRLGLTEVARHGDRGIKVTSSPPAPGIRPSPACSAAAPATPPSRSRYTPTSSGSPHTACRGVTRVTARPVPGD